MYTGIFVYSVSSRLEWCHLKAFLVYWNLPWMQIWLVTIFVFVPVIILFKSNMDAIYIIMFYCLIHFQPYQTWHVNNYLNLNSSHAIPWEGEVLVMLHCATSHNVAVDIRWGCVDFFQVGRTDRPTDRLTDWLTDRGTDRQTVRETDRWTDRETHLGI